MSRIILLITAVVALFATTVQAEFDYPKYYKSCKGQESHGIQSSDCRKLKEQAKAIKERNRAIEEGLIVEEVQVAQVLEPATSDDLIVTITSDKSYPKVCLGENGYSEENCK